MVSAAHRCCVQAQRGYKQILELYPHSAKLLRSYGRFMQGVKGNPNASMRYFSEADRLEAQQQEVGEGLILSHRATSATCRVLAPVAALLPVGCSFLNLVELPAGQTGGSSAGRLWPKEGRLDRVCSGHLKACAAICNKQKRKES